MNTEKKYGTIIVREGQGLAEASYDLPAMCQKTFEYLCMKANDSDLVTEDSYGDICLDFNVTGEYVDLLGRNPKGIYAEIRKVFEILTMCSVSFVKENKILHTVSLVKELEHDPTGKNYARIQLSKHFKPYIRNAEYDLTSVKKIMNFESKYAIRLYKLLKERYKRQEEKKEKNTEFKTTVLLEELKDKFKLKYDNTTDVKRKVLEPAIREINEKTEMQLQYKKIKNKKYGNIVNVAYVFTVKKKEEKTKEGKEVNDMADKRMFSKKVVESDMFIEMPASSQALYFHLGMNADDDGFVSNPRTIARMLGSSKYDYQILLSKNFVKEANGKVMLVMD